MVAGSPDGPPLSVAPQRAHATSTMPSKSAALDAGWLREERVERAGFKLKPRVG
jgi:hypothetical protein